eukprot:CCRYP_008263-RA/>CCRYP_008263-RA protein AED:0.08 eAED:0.08 QI:98/1/1/1/1/1/2/179/360
MSTIRYFLPEDGDSEDTPNVFLAPKPNRPGYPPLLGQIKDSFPLPGIYHFRFKTALIPGSDRDKNAVAVWMDCVDDSEPVPTWQSSVVAKVTRVSAADMDDEYDEDFGRADSNVSTGGYSSSRSSMSKQQFTNNHTSQHSSDSLLGAFDDPPAPAPPAPAASNAAPSGTGNLLDVDHPPPAPPASGGSLLDMDHLETSGSGYQSSGANTPTPHDELLNMTAPMPAPMPPQGALQVPPQYPQRGQPQMQQQQQRPPQQGYPMQYPHQGQQGMGGSMPGGQQGMGGSMTGGQQGMGGSMTGGQQRMGMMPNQQGMGMQQGQQQPFNQSGRGPAMNGAGNKNSNAFDKFSGNTLDPLGSLKWS